MRTIRIVLGVLGLLLLVSTAPAWAQRSGELPAVFEGVGIDEQLGEPIPQDLTFLNEQGEPVRLGDYLRSDGKPVILTLVYHNCPMLCNLLLDGFTRSLQDLAWKPGEEYDIVTVSFAPDEGPDLARRQKDRYLDKIDAPQAEDGWHFLTGEKASIDSLAAAVGFEFKYIEEADEYAHPAALIFLSSEGTITRYLHGMDFPPRDVRNALVEASEGTVGTPLDRIVLYCFQYDPAANSYVLHAFNAMRLGGFLTLLVLGIALYVFWRREGRDLDEAATLST